MERDGIKTPSPKWTEGVSFSLWPCDYLLRSTVGAHLWVSERQSYCARSNQWVRGCATDYTLTRPPSIMWFRSACPACLHRVLSKPLWRVTRSTNTRRAPKSSDSDKSDENWALYSPSLPSSVPSSITVNALLQYLSKNIAADVIILNKIWHFFSVVFEIVAFFNSCFLTTLEYTIGSTNHQCAHSQMGLKASWRVASEALHADKNTATSSVGVLAGV